MFTILPNLWHNHAQLLPTPEARQRKSASHELRISTISSPAVNPTDATVVRSRLHTAYEGWFPPHLFFHPRADLRRRCLGYPTHYCCMCSLCLSCQATHVRHHLPRFAVTANERNSRRVWSRPQRIAVQASMSWNPQSTVGVHCMLVMRIKTGIGSEVVTTMRVHTGSFIGKSHFVEEACRVISDRVTKIVTVIRTTILGPLFRVRRTNRDHNSICYSRVTQ